MFKPEVNFLRQFLFSFSTFLCLLSGLDIDTKRVQCPRFLRSIPMKIIFIFLVRALLCIQVFVFSLDNIISRFRKLSSRTSSTDCIRIVFTVLHAILHAQSLRCLWSNQAFMKELLENPLHMRFLDCRKTLAYLLCWLWYTGVDIGLMIEDIRHWRTSEIFGATSLPLWCGICSKQCQYLIFILYSLCQSILKGYLDQLHSLVGVTSYSEILQRKQAVRRITANINKTFSTTFGILYVKIFILFYLFLSDKFIDWGAQELHTFFLMGPFLQLFTLYDLARAGTDIMNGCRKTAFKVLSQQPKSAIDCDSWSRVTQMVAFDERQDALMILDCFKFAKESLFSYLGMVITCIAVLLQFDYRLLAKLDNDKLHYNVT